MRAVLGARLGQLPDRARRLTEVAAVIGRPFSVGLMVSATGIGEHESIMSTNCGVGGSSAIRGSHRFQSRQASGGCPGDGQSSSSTSTPPGRRRGDRRRAPQRHRRGRPATGRTLRPGRHGRTGHRCLPRGGARAVAVSALDEAVTMFRRALSLLAEVPPSPDRDALELDIRIAIGSPSALEGYGSKDAPALRARPFPAASSPTRGPTDSPRSRPRPAAGLPLRRRLP